MTSLPARAGSFSGHARRYRPRCVLKAPSEPQDVLCGVNVPVDYVAASAAVRPFRERLLGLWKRTATATCLRGVLRVNREDSYPSFFRFGCEDVQKPTPARVMRRLRKAGPGYTAHVERFMDYQAVSLYQFASLLVVEVTALVRRSLVQTSYTLTSLAAAVRALLFSRERTLRPSELLLSAAVVARGLHGLAIGGRKEAFQSEVYTNSIALSGDHGSIAHIADEDGVPLAAGLLDRDSLDLALKGAV